jgi:hypothetical protein
MLIDTHILHVRNHPIPHVLFHQTGEEVVPTTSVISGALKALMPGEEGAQNFTYVSPLVFIKS